MNQRLLFVAASNNLRLDLLRGLGRLRELDQLLTTRLGEADVVVAKIASLTHHQDTGSGKSRSAKATKVKEATKNSSGTKRPRADTDGQVEDGDVEDVTVEVLRGRYKRLRQDCLAIAEEKEAVAVDAVSIAKEIGDVLGLRMTHFAHSLNGDK